MFDSHNNRDNLRIPLIMDCMRNFRKINSNEANRFKANVIQGEKIIEKSILLGKYGATEISVTNRFGYDARHISLAQTSEQCPL